MPVYKGNLKHIDTNNVLTLAGQRAVDDATPEMAEEVCQTVVRLAQPVSVFYQFFYDKDTHTFYAMIHLSSKGKRSAIIWKIRKSPSSWPSLSGKK